MNAIVISISCTRCKWESPKLSFAYCSNPKGTILGEQAPPVGDPRRSVSRKQTADLRPSYRLSSTCLEYPQCLSMPRHPASRNLGQPLRQVPRLSITSL